MTRLGFIGIGLMGLPMTTRLLQAGFSVSVWNRDRSKCQTLQAKSAHTAQNLADMAAHCDVIMLCVSDTQAVEDVVFGVNGLFPHLRNGQIIVDFSSISPMATRDFASRVSAMGVDWIDCPVSGGVIGAEQGTLVMMAGGKADRIQQITPFLTPLSQRITRMGETGAGQVTKVCNQLIVAANAMLIAEAVAIAETAGVDASLLAPALAGGFADSKPFQILTPRMASRQFEPVQWKVATLLKDLDNARQVAQQLGLNIPVADMAAQLMRAHASQHSQDDLSSIISINRTLAC